MFENIEQHHTKSRLSWFFWTGICISILFLYLSIRKVEWSTFVFAISKVNIFLLVTGALVLCFNFFVLTARWRVLLQGVSDISLLDTYDFYMVGMLVNCVLPSRLGEVTRAMMVKYYTTTPASKVLGSIVLDRLLDMAMLGLLALGMSNMVTFPPAVHAGMVSLAVVLIIAFVFILILAYYEKRVSSNLERYLFFLPQKIAKAMTGLISRFSQGLCAVKNWQQIVRAGLLTVLVWTISGISTICTVTAFHFPIPWYAG